MPAGLKRVGLLAAFLLAAPIACGEDLTNFNTIETISAATIDKIKISDPKFFFHRVVLQSYGGLDEPVVSFGVSNESSVAIGRIYLRATLKRPGSAAPLAAPQIDYRIPGGLWPGETKHFNLHADVVGDWNQVSEKEARGAVLSLTPYAVEDTSGERIVK